jgi:hypothetical protein
MADILDILNIIRKAQYGREVRQAIVDGISQCYEDGKAGVNDLEARRLIEAVTAVNEQQEVEIINLRMQIEEIISGGPSTETVDTTTTEVPTVIFDTGSEDVYVQSQGNSTKAVTFNKTFTEAPAVICGVNWRDAGGNKTYAFLAIAPANITTSGFDIVVANYINHPMTPTVRWIAIQPTTVEINTEIVVPATDDLTQEQIDNLIGLLE